MNWPLVKLGEVMKTEIDAVPVDPVAEYPIAGVYGFGRGLFCREPLAGSATTYKVLHRLRTDQFVLSQLKGWEGALARVLPEFDGWFLSPQFPTFRSNPERLDIGYFTWYCKQSCVWDQLRSTSRGMGARRDSVSPASFLSLTLSLPPVEEQRRIVARVDAIASCATEARALQTGSAEDMDRLLMAVYQTGDLYAAGRREAVLIQLDQRLPDVA
jgi:type I restriction enzyme S subunit